MNARPFIVHPHAQVRRSHGISTERGQSPSGTVSIVDSSGVPTRRNPQDPGIRNMMAEMKLSLAAHQLSEQVKESIRFWREFQDEYSKEVDTIKVYVGVSVLQQIWQNKVAYNRKYKRADKDDQQFEIQSMKLESCLNQFDEATQLLVGARSSDHSNGYDSRQHHLAKMQAAGNLVVGLSKRSVTDEAACIDLLNELAELETLVDPKSSTASMLHRFDKRQTRTPTGSEGNTGQSSKRPANEDASMEEENNPDDCNANNWGNEENAS
ncbi:hypothetical protein F5Y12DRAFT_554370 [Xylaria sp. FL1777]|nr:hypothetical protein F5Y12DRAFT_554370 [Xylaria sp. FL1777]